MFSFNSIFLFGLILSSKIFQLLQSLLKIIFFLIQFVIHFFFLLKHDFLHSLSFHLNLVLFFLFFLLFRNSFLLLLFLLQFYFLLFFRGITFREHSFNFFQRFNRQFFFSHTLIHNLFIYFFLSFLHFFIDLEFVLQLSLFKLLFNSLWIFKVDSVLLHVLQSLVFQLLIFLDHHFFENQKILRI